MSYLQVTSKHCKVGSKTGQLHGLGGQSLQPDIPILASWQQHHTASSSPYCHVSRDPPWSDGMLQQDQSQISGLRQPNPHRYTSSMDLLCRDMQQLDAEIADLDLNLAAAGHKLCT